MYTSTGLIRYWGWRPMGSSMSFRFEDKNNDESKYNEQQQKNAFPFAGILLISVENDHGVRYPI